MLGVHEVPAGARRWEVYEGLYRLWVGYVWEVLGLSDLRETGEGKEGHGTTEEEEGDGRGRRKEGAYVTAASAGSKLASADFHGAQVEVVRSRCVGRVGTRGIVVKDTKFTFEIITRKNELKSTSFLSFFLLLG